MDELPPTSDPLRCPRCYSIRGFHAVSLRDDSSAGCLFLLFGGIIPYLIYSSQRSNLMECEHCHLVFRPPAVSGEWQSKLVLLAIVAGVGVILYFWWSAAMDRLSP